jgi:hypothetical protein
MAGYVINTPDGYGHREFHIDERDLTYELTKLLRGGRVMTLQVDGDELDAVLWGLDNYKKPTT